MADAGHEAAEERLRAIEDRVTRAYGQALRETRERLEEYLRKFAEADERMREQVRAGTLAQSAYERRRADLVLGERRFRALVRSLSEDLARASENAARIVNGELPEVYASNHDWGTFEIESGTTVDTAYTLYDRATVARLLRDDPDLYPRAGVDDGKQRAWDRRHIVSAVTQGLLQGEPMDRIAGRMERVVGMDAGAAMRAARTCVTGAENAGRVDSYRRAAGMGIPVRKRWLATLDGRTRHSHRRLDDEVVGVDERFSNGCMYPGDPDGEAGEVYNCRCTLVADLAEFPAEQVNRASKLGEMTYEEWRGERRKRGR